LLQVPATAEAAAAVPATAEAAASALLMYFRSSRFAALPTSNRLAVLLNVFFAHLHIVPGAGSSSQRQQQKQQQCRLM
jgi:diadenosine tetraphosphate (Ap4A) HIT family hydrolase